MSLLQHSFVTSLNAAVAWCGLSHSLWSSPFFLSFSHHHVFTGNPKSSVSLELDPRSPISASRPGCAVYSEVSAEQEGDFLSLPVCL